jgi:hypothetical protein
MKAIITYQPTSEVTRIERLPEQTIFYLANGQVLRVGEALEKLEAELNQNDELPRIALSQPPPTECTIFYHPFMPRSIYDVVWPLVRTHRKIQKAFRRHPRLQAIALLNYDALRDLPLEAYVSSPFGLFLGHPYNFMSRAPDTTLPDGANEYRCGFQDGNHLVSVFINVKSLVLTVEQDRLS